MDLLGANGRKAGVTQTVDDEQRFVTGQNQNAAPMVAREMLRLVAERSN